MFLSLESDVDWHIESLFYLILEWIEGIGSPSEFLLVYLYLYTYILS